jgi:hypothetical protein
MVKYYDMSTAAARAQSNKERKEAAEQKEQAQVDKVRANTMPIGSAKKKADPYADELKMGTKNYQKMFGKKPDEKFKPDISKESNPNPNIKVTYDADKGKKKKDPIVSKAELDKSGFTNLRDFMNNYENKDGKFVKRAKALTRRDGKPANAVVSETTKNPKGFNRGGSASSRGDGIAQRGKTRA